MICLSFDTDHMSESRLAQFLSDLSLPGVGTFFCTQPYECLKGTRHEIAPHPLLEPGGEWDLELQSKRREFPEAVGWRSHSCVFSHNLSIWIGQNGYRYISTHDQFGQAGIRPVRHPWGVWHLPIYYMDNMDFSRRRFWGASADEPFRRSIIDTAIGQSGLYVFDFHPIHLALNSPDANYYFSARERFLAGAPVSELRFDGYGTAGFFGDLCAAMRNAGIASFPMAEALKKWQETAEG